MKFNKESTNPSSFCRYVTLAQVAFVPCARSRFRA